jgi:serpin B
MDGTKDLSITGILHKAYIAVDENGTEAAAATAVVVGLMSLPSNVIDLKIDHPFIYLIQDNETGAILFMGRVTSL